MSGVAASRKRFAYPIFALLALFWATATGNALAEESDSSLGQAVAKQRASEKPPADHVRVQGTWQIESFRNDGATVPKKALKHMRVVIDKDSFALQNRGKDSLQLNYKLKSGGKPMSIGRFDTTHELDPGKPISQLGIFQFDGKRLRIAIAGAGQPRPKDFKSADASLFELVKQPKKVRK